MTFQVLITDLNGVVRRFVREYESMKITRRLGDFSEFELKIDVREAAAEDLLIAERALKVYGDDGALRFFGQIWEPLETTETTVTAPARDPFAGLASRRVRESTTYTDVDAGAIAYDRVDVQNGYRDTFLAGASSISRPGTLTDDSPVVAGLVKTVDLREGMGVDGIGLIGCKIASVDSSTQVTLDKPANLLAVKDGHRTSGSAVITGISDTSDLEPGMSAAGTGIPAGATIASIDSATQVTLSANATSSGTSSVTYTAPATQTLTFTEGASVPRTVTYDPGKREDEIISELSGMADGYFFRVDPLDDTPGKMGTLRVLYPDAGISRPEVRFGYGPDTLGNLTTFKLTRMLPLTRLTVASQDANGGRIAAAAENTDASTEYGLFEDELSFTDVTDTALLQAAADAGTKPTPPLTIELTPDVNSPLLFEDFDVGDFVRLNIAWGVLNLATWVRVIEATLSVDKQGIARLDSLVVETLSGAKPNQDPAKLFRAQLDLNRRRIEALERRVQDITTTAAAAPPPPTASGGSDGSTAPPPDDNPPPPPPPAPPSPPTISISATGINERDNGVLKEGVLVTVSADFKGLSGTVFVSATPHGGGSSVSTTLSGSGQVFLATGSGLQDVAAQARTSAGTAGATASANVPSVTAE